MHSGKRLELTKSSSVGLIWSVKYEKGNSSSSKISFHHVHYDLYYQDGKESGWNYNPWR
jgi:hypothetical protein